MHEKEIFVKNQSYTDFKATLNPEQLSAVENTEGPLLILAGAGTGKTKVLTSRIANILSKGALPGQILAVTFTNKAAREMAQRVENATGDSSAGIWLGTFHSIATRILRAHAQSVGLKPNFIIIDTADQLRLLKQIIIAKDIDEKKWTAKKLAMIIGQWKDKGLLPEQVARSDSYDFGGCNSLELYHIYQSRLLALNVADFGDLLLYNLVLLQNNTDILQHYQRRFKYILVDEYQDTNLCQYLWLRLLAQENKNICCVGDDDQSIYGWRGAEVDNILKFERDFKNATIIRLERNYRSTSNILSAASKLIAHNKDRLGKTLWTQDNEGEPIQIISLWDDKEEASYVAQEIALLQKRHGHNLSEIAVLVRAGFQTRAFEERFVANSISYKVIGGLRFYERAEIKDIIAYLRLIMQSSDDLAFERIVNTPKRGVGDIALKTIRQFGRQNELSMLESAMTMSRTVLTTNHPQATVKSKISKALDSFIQLIQRWQDFATKMSVAEFVEIILNESGYLAMLKNENTIEADGRIENIKELIIALQEFDSIEMFLEHVSLVSDIDSLNQDNMVGIMTMHAAKGLEFETVFLPGWEEGIFPSQRSVNENATKGLEEERRLAYVGITRAKKRCYILCASNRRVYNQLQCSVPSRFIAELPQENIEKVNLGNGLTTSINTSMWQNTNSTYKAAHWKLNTQENNNLPSNRIAINTQINIGTRVFHIKFGYGKVIAKSGNQLDVSFEKSGTKKVVASYVELA